MRIFKTTLQSLKASFFKSLMNLIADILSLLFFYYEKSLFFPIHVDDYDDDVKTLEKAYTETI